MYLTALVGPYKTSYGLSPPGYLTTQTTTDWLASCTLANSTLCLLLRNFDSIWTFPLPWLRCYVDHSIDGHSLQLISAVFFKLLQWRKKKTSRHNFLVCHPEVLCDLFEVFCHFLKLGRGLHCTVRGQKQKWTFLSVSKSLSRKKLVHWEHCQWLSGVFFSARVLSNNRRKKRICWLWLSIFDHGGTKGQVWLCLGLWLVPASVEENVSFSSCAMDFVLSSVSVGKLTVRNLSECVVFRGVKILRAIMTHSIQVEGNTFDPFPKNQEKKNNFSTFRKMKQKTTFNCHGKRKRTSFAAPPFMGTFHSSHDLATNWYWKSLFPSTEQTPSASNWRTLQEWGALCVCLI